MPVPNAKSLLSRDEKQSLLPTMRRFAPSLSALLNEGSPQQGLVMTMLAEEFGFKNGLTPSELHMAMLKHPEKLEALEEQHKLLLQQILLKYVHRKSKRFPHWLRWIVLGLATLGSSIWTYWEFFNGVAK